MERTREPGQSVICLLVAEEMNKFRACENEKYYRFATFVNLALLIAVNFFAKLILTVLFTGKCFSVPVW